MKIEESPYKKKQVGEAKLYKRIHGLTQECSVGSNIFNFSIPYPHAKITEIEVINAPAGTSVDLMVLDDASGTYTTIPNYLLNQFAFNAGVAKDYYKHSSSFDADLYYNMTLNVVIYLPTGATNQNICINFGLDEVKA